MKLQTAGKGSAEDVCSAHLHYVLSGQPLSKTDFHLCIYHCLYLQPILFQLEVGTEPRSEDADYPIIPAEVPWQKNTTSQGT